jgi:hypothetical protein
MAFSITLMNASFILLFIAFLMLVFNKEVKYIPTGLEIPIIVFLGAYSLSSVFSRNPLKCMNSLVYDYWYILHMYLIIYLFEEKEVNKFIKYLSWTAVGIGIYTVLQSLVGLNFNLNFQVGETLRMVSPELKKFTHFNGHPVYLATGIMGQHHTFGGQILMLLFFTYGVCQEKWRSMVIFIALVLSFIQGVWLGFMLTAVIALFLKNKMKPALRFSLLAICIISIFVFLRFNPQLNGYLHERISSWGTSLGAFKNSPFLGVGAGEADALKVFKEKRQIYFSSIYSDIATEGGLLTFCAFLFFLFRFISLYFTFPAESKGRWKRIHMGCFLGIIAVLIAGLFRNYLQDAENSVLFWTLAGLAVKIKTSEWKDPIMLYKDYENENSNGSELQ